MRFNIDTPIVKITIRAPDDFTLEAGPTPSSPCSAPTPVPRSLCRRACASSTFLRDSRAEKAVI